ncbi:MULTISPECIES: AAA family ATPase [Streptomyces]|uniref:AAA family ATPase n=1 Tax=Streptomyces chilikensis TaxID=1194079 RepID=A0ABV3EW37_9ACTN|nr:MULTISPECIES: AAA family ATPase [Streptomyces]MDH6224866.1 putative kinase [Streptomyces sp. MJP52]
MKRTIAGTGYAVPVTGPGPRHHARSWAGTRAAGPARARGGADRAARCAAGGAAARKVCDLRGKGAGGPGARLVFGARDVVVVTGLPGSGKSTMMRRAVGEGAVRIDSQDTRDRWDARMPRALPYAVYRPLVRLDHYAGLRRALRGPAPVVVHDCGTQRWVRSWLGRAARRRGGTLRLVLLDATPGEALQGQRARGRGVSRYAFARHRKAVGQLLSDVVDRGRLPRDCGSAVLLDRAAARALRGIGFAPDRGSGVP